MTHKIKGIEKEVCTCEQKIAYNFAFRWHINSDCDDERIPAVVKEIYSNESIKNYDVDVIAQAFQNGAAAYKAGCKIIGSYAEIGKIFTI